MRNFVGIDLGTTNSAICSYDGSDTRIWKSPEQNDVTPSVIYIDPRGNKYVGKRAYDSAPHNPDNTAMLFKRLMGTSTPINFSAANLTKTPEDCSSEVLKVLFGYLPEEIRSDLKTGTVITVPAAFNQMQKDATMQAAGMAGFENVALMQEPVAAVMSVMRTRKVNGMFLIYDLGGGTLDIAIAESLGGRVNLLSHGGIPLCGGRDFDRVLVDNVVRPWLLDNFNLPEDFAVNSEFNSLIRLAVWATERAKIELSARNDSVISLSETELRTRDFNHNEIYLDIPLSRETYDKLIAERVVETIDSARDTLKSAGISSNDLERIVFVGGPTNYKPLRDKVSFELGIQSNTEVNPMTAVAEGASLYAESIDWDSNNRSRKGSSGEIISGSNLGIVFKYIARTPEHNAKIAVQLNTQAPPGSEFQIDSVDTGWTSGRIPLENNAIRDVSLTKNGENIFNVFVFDSMGSPVSLEQDRIVITRTAATVDAIPASHSIAIAALDKIGGPQVLEFLVKSGDSLPKEGRKTFKAAESLKAGSIGSLNFALWEGEIEDPITDNRPIGVLKISGTDFDDGVIPAGADLVCEYEILDSGNIILEVSVPSIGGTFHSGKNFYSRQEGQIDYTSAAAMIVEEGERTQSRIDEINEVVTDPKLKQAQQKIEVAVNLDPEETETETAQQAMENVLEARRLLSQVRKEHLKEIRQIDLDHAVLFFDTLNQQQYTRQSEELSFSNLAKTAQRSIDRNDLDFEHHLDELKGKIYHVLWRQDWFVVERFKSMVASSHLFADKHRYEELTETGLQLLRSDEIEELRAVVGQLFSIQIGGSSDDDVFDVANIIRE